MYKHKVMSYLQTVCTQTQLNTWCSSQCSFFILTLKDRFITNVYQGQFEHNCVTEQIGIVSQCNIIGLKVLRNILKQSTKKQKMF